jgi:hypothetical protein
MTDQERYDKAKNTVERIEREGIKSWATSIGYQINIAEMNKVGPKLGYGIYNDMRDKKQKTMNVPQQIEYCVLCGSETPYTINTHIDFRDGYVEGVGQLCRICYYKNPEEKTHISIPKNTVRDTPNDAELGGKVRQIYWESEK